MTRVPDARKTRGAGRAAYLRRRRDATRTMILVAARHVFARANYLQAKIEDIIRQAGVSRATFYDHFGSKLDLAFAIYDEIAPQNAALFARLPGLVDSGDPAAMRSWLDDFVGMYVEHRYVTPLIAQLQLFESGFRSRILEDTEALMDALAAGGVSGFAPATRAGDPVPRARTHGRLLLNRVAAVCGDIARGEQPAEANTSLDIIGTELLAYLRADRAAVH
ncbi:AcrR family transcriptional regulator [Sphingobium sp. OAS761]|uniref:TetR/AcrR family transcriptional regulator n=1 Tax=Sphingobium sp. OAS761 TaxID=2817901 RepID=UPI0020A1BF79|nr:TetR/AcrR family transcriptional regulator [Sphingobium sp. OAS761]MCP1470423.1 AcrR family transcriptional regulator [Sphingobium sp. OAS761]